MFFTSLLFCSSVFLLTCLLVFKLYTYVAIELLSLVDTSTLLYFYSFLCSFFILSDGNFSGPFAGIVFAAIKKYFAARILVNYNAGPVIQLNWIGGYASIIGL